MPRTTLAVGLLATAALALGLVNAMRRQPVASPSDHVAAVEPRLGPALTESAGSPAAATPQTPRPAAADPSRPHAQSGPSAAPSAATKPKPARPVRPVRPVRAEVLGKRAVVPPQRAALVPARRFAWPPVAGARAYVIRFDRAGKRIFETRTASRSIDLSNAFRFSPGRYRWQVLPVLGSGADSRLGAAIVDSTFSVSAPAGSRAGRP